MKPILCNYYITYRCNAKCAFCDIWKKKSYRESPDCSLADVAQNLPLLKKIGVKFIDFTGGEPLLHPALLEMLRRAKRYRFYTSVTTNCLLYPERAKELNRLIDLLHHRADPLHVGVDLVSPLGLLAGAELDLRGDIAHRLGRLGQLANAARLLAHRVGDLLQHRRY